jgi:hypothetical protein
VLDELIDAGDQVIAVHHQRGLGASRAGRRRSSTGNHLHPARWSDRAGRDLQRPGEGPRQWLGLGSKAMSEGNVESLRQTVNAFKQGDRTTGLQWQLRAPPPTFGGTLVGRLPRGAEGLLKQAPKRARRLACGPLAGPQRSINAPLRVARQTGKEKARDQQQNADDDDCSDDHLGSLRSAWLPCRWAITPSDCHLRAPRGSRVSVEARLRAKIASPDEGVRCGRMGRARELALTHESHGPERFRRRAPNLPLRVGCPSNVQPWMNGNVPGGRRPPATVTREGAPATAGLQPMSDRWLAPLGVGVGASQGRRAL